MRWLIDYVRSCFCDHEWFPLKQRDVLCGDSDTAIGVLYYTHCEKCMCRKKWTVKA